MNYTPRNRSGTIKFIVGKAGEEEKTVWESIREESARAWGD